MRAVKKNMGKFLIGKKINFSIEYWVEILFLIDHSSVRVEE
jgi:hypothetical protein